MKSTEFITEGTVQEVAEQWGIHLDMINFVSNIKKDCQPYLKEVNNDPFYENALFRGMDGGNQMMTKKNVRLDDRKPTDSSEAAHNLANVFFKQKFGLPFRNGIFAVGSYDRARGYGEDGGHPGSRQTYVIFPIGNLKYTWSPYVEDLFTDVIYPANGNHGRLLELLNEGEFTSTGLVDAIDYGHEVMIWCKQYYAIQAEYVRANSEGLEAVLKAL